jgi:hypothetical protein
VAKVLFLPKRGFPWAQIQWVRGAVSRLGDFCHRLLGRPASEDFDDMTPIFRSGTSQRARTSKQEIVIAVDLGFSKRAKSCGLAWRKAGTVDAKSLRYGECIATVGGLLSQVSSADLILEAPLSGFFSESGDPIERGNFERKSAVAERAGQARYWYTGPGAATCLAAVFFLRRLKADLAAPAAPGQSPLTVTLYEGFITFKTGRSRHDHDARRMLECFQDAEEVVDVSLPPGSTAITVLDVVLASGAREPPPAIVIPRGPVKEAV